jgi:hypothetical protein
MAATPVGARRIFVVNPKENIVAHFEYLHIEESIAFLYIKIRKVALYLKQFREIAFSINTREKPNGVT